MPYIGSDGRLMQNKPFGVSLLTDYFWGVVGFFTLFFRGLFHLDDPGTQKGQYGGPRQRVPGRRTIGGFRPSGGAPPPPACMGGG